SAQATRDSIWSSATGRGGLPPLEAVIDGLFFFAWALSATPAAWRYSPQSDGRRTEMWEGSRVFLLWCISWANAFMLDKELNMTAYKGWIVTGLLVLILLGIVGLGAEIQALPYLWRATG